MLHYSGNNMMGKVPPTTGQNLEKGCPPGAFRSPGPDYDLLLEQFGFRKTPEGCWMLPEKGPAAYQEPAPQPQPAPQYQPEPRPKPKKSNDTSTERERQFVQILNNYRRQHGLHPLTINRHLNKAARWHSQVMKQTGQVSHVIAQHPYGESVYDRAPRAGYTGNGMGENIAFNSRGFDPQQAFNAWKNSPGHNKQMLDPDWYVIGIGDDNTHWTTVFGTMRDGSEEAEPFGAVESKWGGPRMKK